MADPRIYSVNGMLAEITSDMARNSATFQAAVKRAISATIKHEQKERYWFNESRSKTFSTVSGTDFYTFNNASTTGTIGWEFDKVDSVTLVVSSTDVRELDRVDYAIYEAEWDQEPSQDIPYAYAYVEEGLRLHYIPNAIYTVRVTGHLIVPYPASDDDLTCPWFTETFDLIMSRTKAFLYVHRLEDTTNAAMMVQATQAERDTAKDATADKLRTGFIIPTEF